MKRNEFEKLVNREIDGLLTPEEEARLNDYTSRDPKAAEEQRALHGIHRAFQGMEPAECPAGLADTISDRVLAGPAPLRRFPTPPRFLNRAAAAILILAVAGLGGWWIGHDQEVSAGEGPEAIFEERQLELWTNWGLDAADAQKVVQVKMQYFGAEGTDAGDLETGRVLEVLETAGKLDRYCRERGMTLEEAKGLIERAKKKR